jgi:hypothetical protein
MLLFVEFILYNSAKKDCVRFSWTTIKRSLLFHTFSVVSNLNLLNMPCSICGSITHHANDCTSVELLQSVSRIKAYWLGENMPEGWTDELVKNWCATSRIGLPYWRRIWSILDDEVRYRGWRRLPPAERRDNRVLQFVRPYPRDYLTFKERVQNYVRPAQLPVAPPRPAPRPVPPRPTRTQH